MNKKTYYILLLFISVVFWIPTEITLRSPLNNFSIIEIIIYIIIIDLMLKSLLRKDQSMMILLKKFPFTLFALLFIGSLIGHFNGDNMTFDMYRIRRMFLWPGLFILVIIYALSKLKQVEKIITYILYSAIMLGCLISVGPIFFKLGTTLSSAESSSRLSYYLSLPLFGELSMHMSQIGVVFGMLIMISFCFFLLHYSERKKKLMLLYIFFFSAILLLSQSRGAIIGTSVSVLFIVWIAMSRSYISKTRVFAKGILIIVFIFSAFWIHFQYSSDTHIYERGISLLSDPFQTTNFLARMNIWERVPEIIGKNLWGYGLFGFPLVPDGNTGVVHNVFLYIYFVGGLIGLMAFIFLHINIIKASYSLLKSDSEYITLITSLSCIGTEIVWLVSGLVDPVAFYEWGLLPIWIMPALVYSIISIKKNNLTLQTYSPFRINS